jgi:hypothetical protein
MLRQLLQNGSPVSLIYGYAGFLATNALSCVANVLADRFSALTEVFIDSVYVDTVVARCNQQQLTPSLASAFYQLRLVGRGSLSDHHACLLLLQL